MTRRSRTRLAWLLAAMLLFAGGCAVGEDDEMVPPTRTVTASPSPEATAAPASVPVGQGRVSQADVVWAQGSVLHVGRRSVDLAPVAPEAFVVVPGGVFVLAARELWFTDLDRLRGTGLAGVTGLGVTADARRILVTAEGAAGRAAYAFDTGTGRSVSAEGVLPMTPAERLDGPDRSDVRVPPGFEIEGWDGPTSFYGVVSQGSRPRSVVRCSLETLACTSLGRVDTSDPVVFGTGQ